MTRARVRRLGAPLSLLRSRSLAALAALALLSTPALAGCGSDDGSGGKSGADAPVADVEQPGESWTVLIYSMADTDLEPFMVTDINEAGEVGSTDDVKVRAFVDRSAGYGEEPLLDQGSWVGGRVLDLTEPGSTELVADLGDVNSADPATLADFVAQGIADHPADKYALIISDHGAGWPGIGPDEGSGYDVLDLIDLEDGIAAGLEEAGVEKLDLLGFDACLMASYEVASAMAPVARRMVASQELEPGHGWDYRSLSVLTEDPTTDTETFGSAIIDGFEQQAIDSGTEADITLSMIDLTQMPALDEAVEAFSDELGETPEVAPAVGRAESTVLAFGKSPDPTRDSNHSDLGLLVEAIGADATEVSGPADAVADALSDVVVDSVTGPATAGATGLSVYLPPSADLADPAYQEIAESDPWEALLLEYYEAGDAIPSDELPEFETADGEPTVNLAEDGTLELKADFAEAALGNLSGAVISYGLVNGDGSVTYLGEEIADVDTESATVYGTYDLTVLVLDDQVDTAYAYLDLDLSDDLAYGFLDIPLTYYPSYDPETPQDALLSAVLDVEGGGFVSETLYGYDPDSQGYGELPPDPEGILVPDVLTYGADGEGVWEPTTDVGLYADIPNLLYDFEPLESGTEIWVELTATDYGGNSATTGTQVTVP
jgi:hypothetical protein